MFVKKSATDWNAEQMLSQMPTKKSLMLVQTSFHEVPNQPRNTSATENIQNVAELVNDKIPDSSKNVLDAIPALFPVAWKQADKYIKNA